MNGVLVVDKPTGPTSHDVVAVARRLLGERRIGHTGTLDPMASGVLPLACGKATRLVRFLSASDKDYRATIRFGVTTDTYDLAGRVTGTSSSRPTRVALDAAISDVLGARLQQPPPYSAKRVDGQRAYDLARRQQPVNLQPVRVVLSATTVDAFTEDETVIRLTCSTGFYVRSFAHDLGQRLGCGASLAALRRTRSGALAEATAVSLEALASGPVIAGSDSLPAEGWVPMSHLLPEFPAVVVDEGALTRVARGQLLEPAHFHAAEAPGPPACGNGAAAEWSRLVGPSGELLGMAREGPVPGSLHPVLVLI